MLVNKAASAQSIGGTRACDVGGATYLWDGEAFRAGCSSSFKTRTSYRLFKTDMGAGPQLVHINSSHLDWLTQRPQ